MAQGKGIRRRLSAEELKELWARWKLEMARTTSRSGWG